MSPPQCCFRTFTFILVLELAVFEFRVEAFSIHRSELAPARALERAENAVLAVRNDLRRDVKPIEVKNDSPPLTVPIKTTAKTEEIQKNEIPSTNVTNAKAYPNGTNVMPAKHSNKKSSEVTVNSTLTTVSTSNQNETSSQGIKTTSPSAAISVPSIKNGKNTTTELRRNNSTATDKFDLEKNNNNENHVSTKWAGNKDNFTSIIGDEVSVNSSHLVNTTDLTNTTNVEASNNETSTIGTKSAVKNSNNSLNTSEVEWVPEKSNTTKTFKETIKVNDTKTVDLLTKNYTDKKIYNTTLANDLSQTKILPSLLDKNTTNTVVSEENKTSTETLIGNYSIPFWKKYTTIERKRVNLTNNKTAENITRENTTEQNTRTVDSSESYARRVNSKEENITRDKMIESNVTEVNKTTHDVRSNTTSTENEDLRLSRTAQNQTSISLNRTNSNIPSLDQLKNDPMALNKISFTTEISDTNKTFETDGLIKNNTRTVKSKEDKAMRGNNDTENNATIDNLIESKKAKGNKTGNDFTSSTENDDLLQSGTAQTKTRVYSDFPSLEQLKNDLLMNVDISSTLPMNKISSTTKTVDAISTSENKGFNTTTSTKAELLDKTGSSTEITISTNALSSKRAGFLDFSVRPTNSTKTSTIQDSTNITKVPGNYTRGTQLKTTPKPRQAPKSMTSQSQLVEDALNEELMKEEVLSDSEENAQRSREENFGAKTPEPNVMQPTSADASTEDKLRVKPISSDKIRNASLYTVNPNYKPLKKIAVQPPKSLNRDPDDNSWRNESLSSLGIVFKANNSSKPFTQVLKNKTETEWNALLEKYSKGDELELRDRLEKITEMRKSKKKKINQFGETVHTDYEEGVSVEATANATQPTLTSSTQVVRNSLQFLNNPTTHSPKKEEQSTSVSSNKKFVDEYEEEDEPDYTLPNIDLKKYFTPTVAAPPIPTVYSETAKPRPATPTVHNYSPDRQPTVQYFPPRSKQPNIAINDYDVGFRNKIAAHTDTSRKVTNPQPVTPPTQVTINLPKNVYDLPRRPSDIVSRPPQSDRNVYLTHPSQGQTNANNIPVQNQDHSGYNQASYVIKHLRNFIDGVVPSEQAASEEPVQGVTAHSVVKGKKPAPSTDYYDYETEFRKDVIHRFAENFNQNSERFKADFPLLYNTSVVHTLSLDGEGGAESSAFMKRLYDDVATFHRGKHGREPAPHCDRTVELSPAYELHYYVPEEEEKEEAELKPSTLAHYRFRL